MGGGLLLACVVVDKPDSFSLFHPRPLNRDSMMLSRNLGWGGFRWEGEEAPIRCGWVCTRGRAEYKVPLRLLMHRTIEKDLFGFFFTRFGRGAKFDASRKTLWSGEKATFFRPPPDPYSERSEMAGISLQAVRRSGDGEKGKGRGT